jgi:hypothetical protein
VVLGRCVRPGATTDTPYNHYSMLRSLEDVFGITAGGADGKGHLGYAGATGLVPFGRDVFSGCTPASGPDSKADDTGSGARAPRADTASLAATGGRNITGGAVFLLTLAVLVGLGRRLTAS